MVPDSVLDEESSKVTRGHGESRDRWPSAILHIRFDAVDGLLRVYTLICTAIREIEKHITSEDRHVVWVVDRLYPLMFGNVISV